MDERDFFDEKSDKKTANLSCPHCQQAQSYMLRRDDVMMCKNVRCRKRFDITGVQSVAFLQ